MRVIIVIVAHSSGVIMVACTPMPRVGVWIVGGSGTCVATLLDAQIRDERSRTSLPAYSVVTHWRGPGGTTRQVVQGKKPSSPSFRMKPLPSGTSFGTGFGYESDRFSGLFLGRHLLKFQNEAQRSPSIPVCFT